KASNYRSLGKLKGQALATAVNGETLFAVTGPDREGRHQCERFGFNETNPTNSAMPLPPVKDPPKSWAIAPLVSGKVAVLANSTGKLLLACLPGDQSWTVGAEAITKSTYLDLFPGKDGELWTQWLDPQNGLQVRDLTGSHEHY